MMLALIHLLVSDPFTSSDKFLHKCELFILLKCDPVTLARKTFSFFLRIEQSMDSSVRPSVICPTDTDITRKCHNVAVKSQTLQPDCTTTN